ncbi:hypothetical protein [Labrys neptuniae]
MMQLSASLFAADPLRLANDIAAVSAHVESFHIDIMDGSFTPDFGLNARLVKELHSRTRIPLDVHLMIREPLAVAIRYAEMGVRSIAVHVEAVSNFAEIASIIKSNGVRVFAALRHTTAVKDLAAIKGEVDGLLFLTAPAGGGEFDEAAFERLAARPRGLKSVVDGRIEPAHFAKLCALDINLAVVGAALFATDRVDERARTLSNMIS